MQTNNEKIFVREGFFYFRTEVISIDPATIKLILMLAADKENWKRAIMIIVGVIAAVVFFLSLCFYVLTMPFQLLGSFFSGDNYDKVKDVRIESGYDIHINENGESTGELIWAVDSNYSYITSYFGNRISPITGKPEHHNGIDILADYGANVYAALDGTVIIAEYSKSYGYYIIIEHGEGITTLYAHNSGLLKKVGDKVLQGEAIAKVGSTGDSTNNHLHFEYRIENFPKNPLEYVVQP